MSSLPRFRYIRSITAAGLVLALLAACGGSGATMQEIDGVLYVLNPAEPLTPDLPVNIIEEFRIGSDEMGDEYLFTGIAGFDVDDEGNIYVLVAQDDRIRVFNPDGTYARTFGRRGQGPGELFAAQGLSFGAGGNLWISNLGRQRVSIYTTAGKHLRDVTFSLLPPMMIQTTAEGFMGLHINQRPTDEPAVIEMTVSLRRFNTEGDTVDTLFDETFMLDIRRMAFEGLTSKIPLYTQDDRGRIWQSRPRTDAYEINVFSPAGGLERVVEKDFTPIAKTEEELAEEKRLIRELIQAQTQGAPFEIDFEPSPYKPATGMLFFDPRGYIWVQIGRQETIYSNAYDLFDLEGQWLTRFELPDVTVPNGVVIRGDRVYVAEASPDDIPRLIVYTVTIGN